MDIGDFGKSMRQTDADRDNEIMRASMCLFLIEHRILEVLQLDCISKHQTQDSLISKLSKKDFYRIDFGQ